MAESHLRGGAGVQPYSQPPQSVTSWRTSVQPRAVSPTAPVPAEAARPHRRAMCETLCSGVAGPGFGSCRAGGRGRRRKRAGVAALWRLSRRFLTTTTTVGQPCTMQWALTNSMAATTLQWKNNCRPGRNRGSVCVAVAAGGPCRGPTKESNAKKTRYLGAWDTGTGPFQRYVMA